MKTRRSVAVLVIVFCGAGIAMGQTVWEQYPENPIIGPGPAGSWDELGHAVNEVVFDGTTYHMWFTSYSSEDRPTDIGHATSSDGIVWTMDSANPVLTRGAAGEWDEVSLWTAAVIHDGTLFHMWYDGWGTEFISEVGYATSPDGSVWTKYSGNPVMSAGAPGDWDDYGPQPQTVLIDSGVYKMWYHAAQIDSPGVRIGYAESPDGLTWIRYQGPVLEPSTDGWDQLWVRFPAVVFDGESYHMWYTGGAEAPGSTDTSSVGYAVSSDGLVWTKHEANPVLGGAGDYFYSQQVLVHGKSCRMWYTHFDGEVDWVNLATAECDRLAAIRFIPAAAYAAGAEGAFFLTDVDVNNAGGQTAAYHFLWLPRGENNSDPMTSETFSLGPDMSVRYDNILSEVFGLEPDSLGALAMMASTPDLLAMSRTCNVPSVKIAGTYGQALPAIPGDDFITTGEQRRILFASENQDLRTNIGCQNGNATTTVVNLALFDDSGTLLETRQMTLPPMSNKQHNRVFEDYLPIVGYVDVWTDTPGGTFYCYGSVLDNVTSDPTTVLPQ